MAIQLICPGCFTRMEAPEEYAGRRVKCPKCHESTYVRMPEPLAAPQQVVVTGLKISLIEMLRLITIFWVASMLLTGAFMVVVALLGAIIGLATK